MAKVLVIDDTVDHLVMFKMLLELQNHQVAIAADKETALPLLDTFSPNIILLDVHLKNGTCGRILCKFIKQTHPHIFIILLSADQKSLQDYRLCDADDIIEKPFEIKTVFAIIDKFVAKI